MKTDLTELNKLESWLVRNGYSYQRRSRLPYPEMEQYDERTGEFNQLIVFKKDGSKDWDAICHYGSYGCSEGLLEIMGSIVKESDGDSVCGYLTADDVIKRVKANEQKD